MTSRRSTTRLHAHCECVTHMYCVLQVCDTNVLRRYPLINGHGQTSRSTFESLSVSQHTQTFQHTAPTQPNMSRGHAEMPSNHQINLNENMLTMLPIQIMIDHPTYRHSTKFFTAAYFQTPANILRHRLSHRCIRVGRFPRAYLQLEILSSSKTLTTKIVQNRRGPDRT